METSKDDISSDDNAIKNQCGEPSSCARLSAVESYISPCDSVGVDSNDETKEIQPMSTLECVNPTEVILDENETKQINLQPVQFMTGSTLCLATPVTLVDGSTVLVQHQSTQSQQQEIVNGTVTYMQTSIVNDSESIKPQQSPSNEEQMPKFIDGQAVQLQDGTTAFIHSTPGEGLHPVQLEDGTTAYMSSLPDMDELYEFTDPDGLNGENSDEQMDSQQLKDEAMTTLGNNRTPRTSSSRALALGDKAFRCPYNGCGRLYTTQHHLKVHERSHTGDRPFRCESPGCNKAFATGYGLKSHTRVHTGEKPYKCPDESCDKAFKTSGDLQKHVRTHTGEKPFKCPFDGCERSFTTSNIRKVHVRTHTGERPYVCPEEACGRSFASATNYKNHVRIHTGEKPYACGIQGCTKRFTEYSSLYKHHVVHTHAKPYLCNLCGKNYRQTSTLAMHMRSIHGIVDESSEEYQMEENDEQNDDDEEDEDDPGVFKDAPAVKPQRKKRQRIQVVQVSSAGLVTNPAAIVTFQTTAGQQPQIESIEGTPHILVVTDPSQFLAFQMSQNHLVTTNDSTNGTDSVVTVSPNEAVDGTAEKFTT